MSEKKILHMLTPHRHISPFDVNMAADAGFEVIIPYEQVELADVEDLVQDAIFSRPPKWGVSTSLFIGGNDAVLALDMMDAARKAMVPPFAINVFADPSGSFTTAAAMVACVEKQLKTQTGRTLDQARIAVFGATGVVGYCSAVIAALEGARVTLAGHDGVTRVAGRAEEMRQRFKADVHAASAANADEKSAILKDADIVLTAAKAGIRVLSAAELASAPDLLVAADVNAVPPSGIEGVEATDDGKELPGTKAVGIGALAIGNIKYKTESGLFRRMIKTDKPLVLDFRDAFAFARGIVGQK
ncbi:methylenetetrahydromethanopterin dehydrogenase [Aureimonas fodinaquatilis]|uniref:Methylenetetrahydromethanopterin dehydrogenase n=1 Tax=Aureimonas fodinaquatilis TaxID=2565783 RepID=A0A5B0DTV3_9HYPH|nr:NAD(P)-dependent methylenetetrahydromethanopterin dehydrogenase [Aureimonas fodinaquatilis]KAA0968619.1 methylenetetrahydromethanopterin dehydrogenase [Aureimonas fodinaquatilis]